MTAMPDENLFLSFFLFSFSFLICFLSVEQSLCHGRSSRMSARRMEFGDIPGRTACFRTGTGTSNGFFSSLSQRPCGGWGMLKKNSLLPQTCSARRCMKLPCVIFLSRGHCPASTAWDVSYPAVGILMAHTTFRALLAPCSLFHAVLFLRNHGCATKHRTDERYNHVVVHWQVVVPPNSISVSAILPPYPLNELPAQGTFSKVVVLGQSGRRARIGRRGVLRATQVPVHGVPRATQGRWVDSTPLLASLKKVYASMVG